MKYINSLKQRLNQHSGSQIKKTQKIKSNGINKK